MRKRSAQISVVVEPVLEEAVQALAQEQGVTISMIVRAAIVQDLLRRGKLTPEEAVGTLAGVSVPVSLTP